MSEAAKPTPDARRRLAGNRAELPCGRKIDDLLSQAAGGQSAVLDEHQQICPHCQSALREVAELWQPVEELAGARVEMPDGVRTVVLAQVRRLVADVWSTLQITDIGAVQVAARVVASTARDIAAAVPGVRVAFGSSTNHKIAALVEKATLSHRHPNAAVGVLGRTAVVSLALSVDYGAQLDAVAREVRQRVITDPRTIIGLIDVTVNVTVDDVIPWDCPTNGVSGSTRRVPDGDAADRPVVRCGAVRTGRRYPPLQFIGKVVR